jgi:Pyruvate/2-oxoacid:ferredoxin oxidoreductase gamma subunit
VADVLEQSEVDALLAAVDAGTRLYINDGLLPLQTAARVNPLALSQAGKPQTWAVAALAEVLRHNGIYPVQALEEAIRLKGKYAEVNLKALAKGRGMLVA